MRNCITCGHDVTLKGSTATMDRVRPPVFVHGIRCPDRCECAVNSFVMRKLCDAPQPRGADW